MIPFVQDIAQFTGNNTSLVYNSDLFIGEIRDRDGVYLVQSSGDEFDRYTEVEYYVIDFFGIYKNSQKGYDVLREIQNLLHRRQHYSLVDNYIYYSNVLGAIQDMDRDGVDRKVWKLSVNFVSSIDLFS